MNIKRLIYIVCFFLIITPFVLSMLYSVPGADDFAMISKKEGNCVLFTAMKDATNMYFTWSGLWIYMFIEFLCNPVRIFGSTSPMYGIVMVVIFVFFLASLYFLLITVFKDIFKVKDNSTIFGCFVLFLLCFLNTGIYTEIFYWFIGSVYMWAASLCILTVAFEIKYFNGFFQKKYAVCLSVIGFVACSFFQAAVFPGMIYIILWIYYCKKEKQILWKALIPLIIIIAGGLISVVAPGNYVRHNSIDDSGLHFVDAIYVALFNEFVVLFSLLKRPFIWILTISFSFIGALIGKDVKCRINPIWYAFIIFLTVFLTCYPLALGISQVGLPNRYYFLLNIYICIFVMVWSFYLGVWMRVVLYENVIKRKKCMKVLAGISFLTLIIWCISCYADIPIIKTVTNLDEIRLCHNNWINLYREIDEREEAEVVLYLDADEYKNDIIMIPGVSYNQQHWENINMANYFGKESISVLYL